MKNTWMNMSVLALSLSAITTTLYAEEQASAEAAVEEQAQVDAAATSETATVSSTSGAAATSETATASSTPGAADTEANQAANALQKQEGDATKETNLQEVFTSNERQYSLIKKGVISSYYDADYTYYRDSRLDLATSDSSSALQRLRVEEDANHTLSNTFTVQYGVLDNVTLSASLPFIAKKDLLQDKTAAGLGDVNFGARWEPFPLKQGRLPLVLFGSLSTKTGDSPYEIGIDESVEVMILADGKLYNV